MPLLGPSYPCGDVAGSRGQGDGDQQLAPRWLGVRAGGAVTVTVAAWAAGVRVEVVGRKADGVPVLRRPDDEAEGSRGLRLVEELAVRWGYERGDGQATTWFELRRG